MDTAIKDSLLVLSGGKDSVTMLYDYRERIAACVNFHYGSNHNERERECARLNCRRLGIELIEIDLGFMGRYFESSLLSGADDIPEADYAEDNMHSTVVLSTMAATMPCIPTAVPASSPPWIAQ